jgi:hypothetical protein
MKIWLTNVHGGPTAISAGFNLTGPFHPFVQHAREIALDFAELQAIPCLASKKATVARVSTNSSSLQISVITLVPGGNGSFIST